MGLPHGALILTFVIWPAASVTAKGVQPAATQGGGVTALGRLKRSIVAWSSLSFLAHLPGLWVAIARA